MRAVAAAIEAGHALDGKIALVTGAGRGVGFAIAKAFARAGARCIILDVNGDEASAARDALAAEGLNVDLLVADVTDSEQVRAAAQQIAAQYSRIDILVNNAGVFYAKDRTEKATAISEDMIQHTIAVNAFGPIRVTNALLHLIPSGGRIINVSSVMGQESHKADGRGTAYRMSKAALNAYTRSLAAELAPRGIMVDALHPGWVKTVVGGPDAKIDAKDSVGTAFFLAIRPTSQASGLFWWDCWAR
jgi:NAD(P)-dependent dehydrogenase (short-subunit alcohol dehydrogenase family)